MYFPQLDFNYAIHHNTSIFLFRLREKERESERVKEKSVQYTINLWIYGIEIALSVSSMHCVFHSLSNNVHPLTNVFLAQYAL